MASWNGTGSIERHVRFQKNTSDATSSTSMVREENRLLRDELEEKNKMILTLNTKEEKVSMERDTRNKAQKSKNKKGKSSKEEGTDNETEKEKISSNTNQNKY